MFTGKKYKVLDPHVGLIQGDGIDLEMVGKILSMAKEEGFSGDNLVFGSGGGLLQKHDRDTQQFAIKCSFATINGKEIDVSKDPVTAPGKVSKAGRLKLFKTKSGFQTISSKEDPNGFWGNEGFDSLQDSLVTVFENGELTKEYTFDEVKENAAL